MDSRTEPLSWPSSVGVDGITRPLPQVQLGMVQRYAGFVDYIVVEVVSKRFTRRNPLLKYTIQAHDSLSDNTTRIYAAINGEATATHVLSNAFLAGRDSDAQQMVLLGVRELEHQLDLHGDQIIERAFSQATSTYFFRG